MKLPAPIMTDEELEQAEEESLELMRDFLDRQKEAKPQQVQPVPRLLSTRQAARYLNLSEWQLRNLVHAGLVTYIPGKYWRFSVDDLDKYIEQHRERRKL